jgi:predicted transcriptional regulator
MKSATFPPLRVDQELRDAAESVLRQGESLSSFVEQSVRANINQRRMQQEFIERGLRSRDEALLTGEYYSAEEVLAEIDEMLRNSSAKSGA